MWLLDTNSQRLKYFQGDQIPSRYAILSHRWQDEEVTFEDIYDGKTSYTSKHGWSKVIRCCEIARRDGFDYVWIDSCCIDKRSSAELSEAINSMYEWYGRAVVCYTYLFDVHDAEDAMQFNGSSWFRRSWTLQELLAPATMYFFTAAWEEIGSKEKMSDSICRVTSIPKSALKHFDGSKYSIAHRMSWAAERQATRIEDVAYSLLGIFDINMPLLYGEGTRAFQRLQEAIMNVSNDLSLFVWEGEPCPKFGILAASPSGFPNFHHSGYAALELTTWYRALELTKGYSFNNAGLFIELEMKPLFLSADLAGVYAAYLHDPGRAPTERRSFEIYLIKDAQRACYRRVSVDGKYWDSHFGRGSNPSIEEGPPVRVRPILIQKDAVVEHSRPPQMGFAICGCPPGVYVHEKAGGIAGNPYFFTGWELRKEGTGQDVYIMVSSDKAYGIIGYLAWTRAAENDFVIVCFGYDFDFEPLCLVFVFPGSACANPLMGLSAGVLMARYLQILPELSSISCARDSNSTMYAIKGDQRTNSKRDIPELSLSVRFLPTKSSLCRMFVDFGSVNVPATALPVRTSESMAKLRHLFGAPERPGVGTMMFERSMARVMNDNTTSPSCNLDSDTGRSSDVQLPSWNNSNLVVPERHELAGTTPG